MAYLRQHRYRRGKGFIGRFINRAIDALPFELHIPGGYQFCGPGTRLSERLARGDAGINPLDRACRTHDIAYHEHKDGEERKKADAVLAKRAWERVVSSDASIGERAAALGVTGVMKLKSKLGGGVKRGKVVRKQKRRQGRRGKGGGGGGSLEQRENKQRLHDEIKLLQQSGEIKDTLQTKAKRFQQTETASSLRRKRAPHNRSPPSIPPHPTTPQERLKVEVEKTRSIIRNKLKALRRFESNRDDFLKTYLTTPMKNAFKEGTKKPSFILSAPGNNKKGVDRGVNTEEEDVNASSSSSSSTAGPLVFNIDDSHIEEADESFQNLTRSPRSTSDSAFNSTEPSWSQYLRTLSQQEGADVVSGPHFRSHSSSGERTLYIGRSQMKIDEGGYIDVGKDHYEARPGLLELIFKKEPNLAVVQERDWNDYKKILRHSFAHREGYTRNGDIRTDNLWKYNHVFATLFPPPPSPAPRALRANTAMQRKATTRQRKKAGKGLRFVTPPDYKYWRDPNKLVRRLRLLLASKDAGNNGHDGEIVEIENELRDAGIIIL